MAVKRNGQAGLRDAPAAAGGLGRPSAAGC